MVLCMELERHLGLMVKVHDMVYLKEIKGEKVPNEAKVYSIYEQHTDIIVKGSREVLFGHKIDFCSRCTWKGWEHFASKVLWSAIAYNIRVMTAQVVKLV